MFWLILGIIGFVVALIFIVYSEWDVCEQIFLSFIALCLAGMLSLCFFLISSAIVSSCAKIDYDVVSDTKIVALKDNNRDTSGNYYVCSVYVNENLYYYYAIETEFGYKTEKISANSSYIKYTEDKTHIEKYEPRFTSDIASLFACPLANNQYVIYCPEGTITPEFNIDLE